MSIESWQGVYYPIPATSELASGSDMAALKHSLQKWKGLEPAVLAEHGLKNKWGTLLDGIQEFSFGSTNCALCVRRPASCQGCPLISCGNENGFLIDRNDPQPMIALLEHKLVETVMNEDTGIL